ncbi:MAG: hypothetical protein HN617_01535 [Planctomycetaceae bacterium]|jgi:hypothetical protein|nr:hypothetical protein [Planctomycetaceae bacterium]MBT4012261.1 hypothetical protein [Planctomycetaceae bacterium]MBT4724581.1 hypothetical protein [Planctomycetaceae bacterium]MBT4844332.1 hypothetical protein [Planctomycetaceae bacterium]MBT5123614.1 hypothetical protein [Planctomycetaceae bacterium]
MYQLYRCSVSSRVRIVTTAWILVVFAAPSLFAEGSLQGLTDATGRTGRATAPSPPVASNRLNHQHHDHYYDDDDSASELELFFLSNMVAAWVLSLPVTVPQAIFGDDQTPGGFIKYPFARAHTGSMMMNPMQGDAVESSHLRIRVDYADNFLTQQKISTHLIFESRNRLGVDASFDYLRESVAVGQHDQLWIGDFNAVWRFAQMEKAQMRIGLGMNWQRAAAGTEKGINFTYGGDFYLSKPQIISADLDWGRLGSAGLFRIRTTYGRQIGRAKVYVGYEYLSIGNFEKNFLITGMSFDF